MGYLASTLCPRAGRLLLEAQGDAFLFLVDLDDVDFELLIDLDDFVAGC